MSVKCHNLCAVFNIVGIFLYMNLRYKYATICMRSIEENSFHHVESEGMFLIGFDVLIILSTKMLFHFA